MKISSFIVAAIATVAIGVGSARADGPDGWQMNQTLNNASPTAATYTAAAARAQAANASGVAVATRPGYDMTYGNG